MCIGQTGSPIETRVKEHHQHIRLYHPEKSALSEHSINLGHRVHLHNTSILAKKLRRTDRVIREAIEIDVHANNISREDVFSPSRSSKPLIRDLRERKQALNKNMTLSGEP
jgi:hypothetical protein